jgi:hypothetical protein
MRYVAMVMVVGVPLLAAPAAHSAMPTYTFYCGANSPDTHTYYMTGLFSATNSADVLSAWKQHLASKNIHTDQSVACESAVNVADLKKMMEGQKEMLATNPRGPQIVADDWTFTSGQVVASDPNQVYFYCSAGAGGPDSYFSDVFGVPVGKSLRLNMWGPFAAFLQTKYNATVTPAGSPTPACTRFGNITDAQQAKQARATELKNAGKQIVETGWHLGT